MAPRNEHAPRRAPRTANLFALFLCPILFGAHEAKADDWPQFLGPHRNNISSETGLIDSFPKEGPEILWQADLGIGYGGAAVREGTVFLLDRIGNEQDRLRCWDLENGEELWSYSYDAPGRLQYDGSRSVPAIDDECVYTIGPFGHFHCVDLATEKPRWSVHLLEEYGAKLPMWGVSQSVLLYEDLVILAPSGQDVGVIAYDRENGDELWSSEPIGGLTYSSAMVVEIDGRDQLVVQGFESQDKTNVVGLDPEDGTELWRFSDWGRMWPIPGPVDLGSGRLLLSAEYGAGMVMIQVKKKDGEYAVRMIQDFRQSGNPYYASQIHQAIAIEEHLYFASNGFDRKHGLVCLSFDGKVKWATRREPNVDLGTWLYADSKLFVLDGGTGKLHIVSPNEDEYRELAQVSIGTGKQIWAPMALANGRLILRDQKQLTCLDLRAGDHQ